jgi:hypothetical protein
MGDRAKASDQPEEPENSSLRRSNKWSHYTPQRDLKLFRHESGSI